MAPMHVHDNYLPSTANLQTTSPKSVGTNDIEQVIHGMLAAADKENEALLAEVIDSPNVQMALKALQACELSTFDVLTRYQSEKLVSAMINRTNARHADAHELVKRYGFYEQHFSFWIKRIEGWACVTDKSRFLLRQMFQHFARDLPMKRVTGDDKAFWLTTRVFTNEKDVLAFYESLKRLYRGNPEDYLACLDQLASIAPIGATNEAG